MGKVTSKDGTGIAFDRSGQGPALILVDGAFCYRGFGPMGPLSERLAPHFTVYKYDRRGRGESGDTPPYAVEREVEDLQALINEAGGQAFVYGISSGAALSLDAAAAFPGIKKLAVYEPPFMVDDSHPLPPANLPEQLYELVSEDLRGDAVELFMVKGIGMPPEIGRTHAPRAGLVHVRRDSTHPGLRRHHHGRQRLAAAETAGFGHGPHARNGRWRQPCLGAQLGPGAERPAPQCPDPHPGRPDARSRQ